MPIVYQLLLAVAGGPLSYLVMDGVRSVSKRIDAWPKTAKRSAILAINGLLAFAATQFPALGLPTDMTTLTTAAIQTVLGAGVAHVMHKQVAAERANIAAREAASSVPVEAPPAPPAEQPPA